MLNAAIQEPPERRKKEANFFMYLVRNFALKTYVVVRTPLRVASHSGRFTHKENKHSSWCVHVQQPLRKKKTARSAHTVHLLFSNDYHNKQRSFP